MKAEKNCYKKRYIAWLHAKNDAKALRRKHARAQVYYCRKCQAWHVGTVIR